MNKDVSSTKSQKTASKSPEKKSEDKKSTPADAQKTESAGQSVPGNKSASQTSISHFSSVSTDEYRSGWQNIFGEGNNKSKKKSKLQKEPLLPIDLEVLDRDIEDELRAGLYRIFQKEARKRGFSLAKLRKTSVIKYNIECHVDDE